MPKQRYQAHLFVCQGKSCSEKGDPEACKKFLKGKIKDAGLKDVMRACTSSCLDLCDQGPNIVVYPEGTWYSGVTPDDWQKIFDKHAPKRQT